MREKNNKYHTVLKCKFCGKEFIAKNKTHAFCSRECQLLYNRKIWSLKTKKQINIIKKQCKNCGNVFETKIESQLYCSPACRTIASKIRNVSEGPNRKFTKDTVFLSHKYIEEGMSIEEVSKMIKRSIESIRKALEMPITPYQEACIKNYFNPYKDRKNIRTNSY